MKAIRSFISQSLLGLAVLSGAAVFAASSAQAETISGQSGNVRAEITYEQPQEFQYKNVVLKIVRAGKTVLEQKLPKRVNTIALSVVCLQKITNRIGTSYQ